MSLLARIFNQESAKAVIVEHELHSISNHCSTSAFDLAYLVEKMDKILKDPDRAKHLDDDQVIDLGVARERIASVVQVMIETSKKF